MQIHHTKLKQAMNIGCYLSAVDGRFRIFWPQRSVELFGATVDEALEEMRAVQNIIYHNPDYRVLTNGNCRVVVVNEIEQTQMNIGPEPATVLWAAIEANEAEWTSILDNINNYSKVEDGLHIKGIPKDGAVAYKEGVPASDCPFEEESPEFDLWNKQWDEAADQVEEEEKGEQDKRGSVVTNRYRAQYTESGHPTHCGDELAMILNNICNNKGGTNLKLFEAICSVNNISLAKYNRTSKGWQGRLRMTGRNLLAKKVREQGGRLLLPIGFDREHWQLSEEWLINAEQKYKPRMK